MGINGSRAIGTRVVRGPSWEWGNQDGGEGHVGTVVKAESNCNSVSVIVQWDSGVRGDYRTGFGNAYDLRVFDNAPTGIKHLHVDCDGCGEAGIVGVRWKCGSCHDYDLCSPCYSGKHNLYHEFIRITGPLEKGEKVPSRYCAKTIDAKGIFKGAHVRISSSLDWNDYGIKHLHVDCDGCGEAGIVGVRWKCGSCSNYDLCSDCYNSGKHNLDHEFIRITRKGEKVPNRYHAKTLDAQIASSPDWNGHDGGAGQLGRVEDIVGKDGQSDRSHARVSWGIITSLHSVGYQGICHLKVVQPATGGSYYPDHLPLLKGDLDEANQHNTLNVGDKVRFVSNQDIQMLQQGHGGWSPQMEKCVGEVGKVTGIDDYGNILVQYKGWKRPWALNPDALIKVGSSFSVGDEVKIMADLEKFKALQDGHGGWNDKMEECLGAVGRVIMIDADGDLQINVSSNIWTVNADCCLINIDRPDASCDLGELETLMQQILTIQEPSVPRNAKSDAAPKGRTMLHLTSYDGDVQSLLFVLMFSDEVNPRDNDGHTPLHWAAYGKKEEAMIILLKKGAIVDHVNCQGQTALHIAVQQEHTGCVKVLLNHHCDMNLQDNNGDTALHIAMGKSNEEVISMLTEHKQAKLYLKNSRHFNALHQAALKGKKSAVEWIISAHPELVDVQKEDGFSALHLAAANNHLEVAELLLTMAGAKFTRTTDNETELMLAVKADLPSIVKLLLERRSDVFAVDNDGCSCLHLAVVIHVNRKIRQSGTSNTNELCLDFNKSSTATIIAYLLDHGADIKQKDKNGCTVSEKAAQDPVLAEYLKSYVRRSSECAVCSGQATVEFKPCGHKITCTHCSMKMKTCFKCNAVIEKKNDSGHAALQSAPVLGLQSMPRSLSSPVLENPLSIDSETTGVQVTTMAVGLKEEFAKFIEENPAILREHVANVLHNMSQSRQASTTGFKEMPNIQATNRHSSCFPQEEPLAKSLSQPITDQADTDSNLSDCESEFSDGEYLDDNPERYKIPVKVRPVRNKRIMSLIKSNEVYFTTSPRGRALIINNMYFDMKLDSSQADLQHRDGSDKDSDHINEMLQQLGFITSLKDDIKSTEFENTIRKEIELEEHHKYGSFILVIMTHGRENEIFGADSRPYPLNKLYNLLSLKNFPAMQGKPKMIFLQACSGARVDRQMLTSDSVGDQVSCDQLSSQGRQQPLDVHQEYRRSCKANNMDDLIVVTASFPGYDSKRHTQMGTWFIRALVEVFMKHAHHKHLQNLIKEVRKRVKDVGIKSGVGGQTVTVLECLNKKIYFFPDL